MGMFQQLGDLLVRVQPRVEGESDYTFDNHNGRRGHSGCLRVRNQGIGTTFPRLLRA